MCCTLYSPWPRAKEKKPFAALSVWRSDLDLEKLRSPIERLKYPKDLLPTIQNDVIWLTDAEVQSIEQSIRGISIPLYLGQPAMAGCDGTRYEFRYSEMFFGASIHWWEDHPTEWRSFTQTITQIAEDLQNRSKHKAAASAPAT